jgi:hypothetical protein
MKILKFFAASLTVLCALAASPTVFAHASFTIGATAGTPVWLGGVPDVGVQFPNTDPTINIPSIAFAGVHGPTAGNNRIIETGMLSTSPTDAQLGGSFNGIATNFKNTLLGQLANYNVSHPPLTTTESVSVLQGSMLGGVSSIYDAATNTFNQGNLYLNPYAGSSSAGPATANGEYNLVQSTGAQYLNVSIAADNYAVTGNYQAGLNDLSYAIYQGVATGPGLQGLTLLGSGTASAPGAEIDFSIAMTGSYLNGPSSGGQFTLVVGDASQSTDNSLANYIAASNFNPYIKIGLWETGAGSANTLAGLQTNMNMIYQEQGINPSAVPLPGAVWLFGSAIAGLIGYGRRKLAAA